MYFDNTTASHTDRMQTSSWYHISHLQASHVHSFPHLFKFHVWVKKTQVLCVLVYSAFSFSGFTFWAFLFHSQFACKTGEDAHSFISCTTSKHILMICSAHVVLKCHLETAHSLTRTEHWHVCRFKAGWVAIIDWNRCRNDSWVAWFIVRLIVIRILITVKLVCQSVNAYEYRKPYDIRKLIPNSTTL